MIAKVLLIPTWLDTYQGFTVCYSFSCSKPGLELNFCIYNRLLHLFVLFIEPCPVAAPGINTQWKKKEKNGFSLCKYTFLDFLMEVFCHMESCSTLCFLLRAAAVEGTDQSPGTAPGQRAASSTATLLSVLLGWSQTEGVEERVWQGWLGEGV